MKKKKQKELPHLIPPSGRGCGWPVEEGVEIWEADFMERDNITSLDRTEWPAQKDRDLIVEFPVRRGEVPNEIVWVYAKAELEHPFRGNIRRIR